MIRALAIVVLGLAACLVLAGVAYAQSGQTDGTTAALTNIGMAIGTILAAAGAGTGGAYLANRRPGQPTEGNDAILARIDERTSNTAKDVRSVRKTQHWHAQLITIALARDTKIEIPKFPDEEDSEEDKES